MLIVFVTLTFQSSASEPDPGTEGLHGQVDGKAGRAAEEGEGGGREEVGRGGGQEDLG